MKKGIEINKDGIDAQKRIEEICDAMKELLKTKNQKYGNSALEPKKIFSRLDASNSILQRLDDKVSRIANRDTELPKINDLCDTLGYLVLLLISMGTSKEDILKLID